MTKGLEAVKANVSAEDDGQDADKEEGVYLEGRGWCEWVNEGGGDNGDIP